MLNMRPYIQGLDEIEFSNLMRNWFKYGELEAVVVKKLDKSAPEHDAIPDGIAGSSYNSTIASRVISALEDTIRNELYGYAKELEDSKTKLEAFLDGVDFALRPTKDEDV